MRRALCLVALLAIAAPASAAVVFTNLGTAAPPATLGPYTVTPFDQAVQAAIPDFTDVSSIPGSPLGGTVDTSFSVSKRTIGAGWATWSHGYAGAVYFTNGNQTVTLTVPAGAVAFYVYAESDGFQVFNFTVTTNDGGTSGAIPVDGNGGANGFGFHTTVGEQITSVTINCAGDDFAIGEFGIAALPPHADLSITKTDGQTTEIPGTSVTYTIVASNAGPDTDPSVSIADTFPAALTGVTWTAVAAGGATGFTAAGSGNIADTTVTMPVGSSVTYTVTATISPAATGTLSNTATITTGLVDYVPANNTATDSDTLAPTADVSVTKTLDVESAEQGNQVTYTIVVANAGPSNAPAVAVNDTFPVEVSSVSWTCVGSSGATCTAGPVSGDISDTANLPAGGSVTYTAMGVVNVQASTTVTNQAWISLLGGETDPTPGDHSATASFYGFDRIPTLDGGGLTVLVLLLALAGLWVVRRTT